MKQINLLPTRIRQRQLYRRTVTLFTFMSILGVVSVLAVWFFLRLEIQGVQTHLSDLQNNQTQAEAAKNSTTNTLTSTQEKDIRARIDQLNIFSKTEVDWIRALNKVAMITPKDISLSNYSYATAGNGLTLKIAGTAPSNLSFAEFVQSLMDDKTITDPKVDSFSFSPTAGTVTFGISALVPLNQVTYIH